MPDGRVEFEITADGRKAFATIDDVTEALKKGGQQWEQNAKQSTDKIGSAFKDMFSALALKDILQSAGKALLDFGKEAISAASDLSEVQNVVDVTFGDNAMVIENWSKNAAAQFGLTETQAKKFTSTLGAMMKSSGLAGDEITKMSTDMAGLAADMASFYNLDFDTAFQKIRAGISGETEPLKQLGINMSVANLNAFALQQGLEKTFEQMSQGEQVMLRYQYMMQATSDAQGDFARTADGFANATRKMETNIEILKTQLGEFLLPVVNQVVGAINTMLEKLTSKPDRTVLDDFASIDLDTEGKIAAIESTAEKARDLTGILEEIGSDIASNKSAAGTMLADLPDGKSGKLPTLKEQIDDLKSKLTGAKDEAGNIDKKIDPSANSNLLKYKGKIGELSESFNTAKQDAEAVDKVLTTDGSNLVNYKGEVEGLGDIFDAVGGNAKGIDEAVPVFDQSRAGEYRKGIVRVGAAAIVAGQEAGKIDDQVKTGADSNLEKAKSAFVGIQTAAKESAKAAAEATGAVPAAGKAAEEADEGSRLWLETCKELVGVIPGLSSIINTETGEIEGGTAAVYAYIDAWEQAQKLSVMEGAHSRKQKALEQEFADLPGLELDALMAERAARKRREAIEAYYKKYNMTFDPDDIQTLTGEEQGNFGISPEDFRTINDLTSGYYGLADAADEARKKEQTRRKAYEEGVEAIKEEEEYLEEERKKTEASTESKGIWSEATRQAASEAVIAFEEAAQAVEDYYNKTRAATKSQVDSTVKGFGKMTSATDAYQEAVKELDKKLADGEITQKEYNKIVNEGFDLPTVRSMTDALEDQAKYMEEYTKDLEKAREKGVSEELLASLSDGSEESALYLRALADASGEEIEKINAAWAKTQEGKETFTDVLTQQKLAADKEFDAMVAKAQETAAALDVSGAAKTSSENNVKAIAEGIAAQVPEVEKQVNAVLAILDKLSGWGISLEPASWGTPEVVKPGTPGKSGIIEGTFSGGTDWIPHDNFIASLHEGEAVLTAEENRVWQHLRRGTSPGVDYDQLGGVMRDNIRAGGNVYLDGQTVGKVVSHMQGNSYRTLQRSGWQA